MEGDSAGTPGAADVDVTTHSLDSINEGILGSRVHCGAGGDAVQPNRPSEPPAEDLEGGSDIFSVIWEEDGERVAVGGVGRWVAIGWRCG